MTVSASPRASVVQAPALSAIAAAGALLAACAAGEASPPAGEAAEVDRGHEGHGADAGADPGPTGGGAEDGAAIPGEPAPPKPDLHAPVHCDPPDVLPADPVVALASAPTLQFPGSGKPTLPLVSHIIDVAVDRATGLAHVVSLPGFFVFGDSPEGFAHLGEYPPGAAHSAAVWAVDGVAEHGTVVEYAHVEPLGGDLVAITARGNPPPAFMFGPGHPGIHGLFVLDVSDPAKPSLVAELPLKDPAGMALAGSLLYVVTYGGKFLVVDVSDPAAPEVVSNLSGFENPWKVVVSGSLAYVADNADGVAVVDLSAPADPVLLEVVPTASGAQELALDRGHLYAAVGAPGVEVFDLADPVHPLPVGLVPTGPSAVGIDADDGLLWVVNQESLLVFDLADPAKPRPIGVQDTPGWALGVDAEGNTAHVADWEKIHVYEVDPALAAPAATLAPKGLYFYDGASEKPFSLSNRGSAPLEIAGAEAGDPRVSIAFDRLVVEPGEIAQGLVTVEGGDEDLDTTFCVATNDPDRPVLTMDVALTSPYTDVRYGNFVGGGGSVASSVTLGEPAPDFVLPDLDGGLHRLSDHLGTPVVLIFFSTW